MPTDYRYAVIGFSGGTPAAGPFNFWMGIFLIGICGGTLVTFISSVIIYPKSATGTTISELRNALQVDF